jgi:hypothetical protein
VKVFLLSVIALLAILVGVYYGSFYVMPSITIINNSGVTIESAKVRLPNSNLDFGSVESVQKSTLHYYLSQNDGEYEYKFIFSDDVSIAGACGYLTKNEINKRVSITVTPNEVFCDLRI